MVASTNTANRLLATFTRPRCRVTDCQLNLTHWTPILRQFDTLCWAQRTWAGLLVTLRHGALLAQLTHVARSLAAPHFEWRRRPGQYRSGRWWKPKAESTDLGGDELLTALRCRTQLFRLCLHLTHQSQQRSVDECHRSCVVPQALAQLNDGTQMSQRTKQKKCVLTQHVACPTRTDEEKKNISLRWECSW